MKKDVLVALAIGLLGALLFLAIVIYMPDMFPN